jgi:hypothetical protein
MPIFLGYTAKKAPLNIMVNGNKKTHFGMSAHSKAKKNRNGQKPCTPVEMPFICMYV